MPARKVILLVSNIVPDASQKVVCATTVATGGWRSLLYACNIACSCSTGARTVARPLITGLLDGVEVGDQDYPPSVTDATTIGATQTIFQIYELLVSLK
jgi:hypothetical protein